MPRAESYRGVLVVPKTPHLNLPWREILTILGLVGMVAIAFMIGVFSFGMGNSSFLVDLNRPTHIVTQEVVETVVVTEVKEVVETLVVTKEVPVVTTVEVVVERDFDPLPLVEDLGEVDGFPTDIDFCLSQPDLELIVQVDGNELGRLSKDLVSSECTRYFWEPPEDGLAEYDDRQPHTLTVLTSDKLGEILLTRTFSINLDQFRVTFPEDGGEYPVYPWFIMAESKREVQAELRLHRIENLSSPYTLRIGDQTLPFETTLELTLTEPIVVPEGDNFVYQWTRGLYDFNDLPPGAYSLTFTLNGDSANQVILNFILMEVDDSWSTINKIWKRVSPYRDAEKTDSTQIPAGTVVHILGQLIYFNEENSNTPALQKEIDINETVKYIARWCLVEVATEDATLAWIWCEHVSKDVQFQQDLSDRIIPLLAPPIPSEYYGKGGVILVE